MSLSDQIKSAAGRAFEFGQEMGLQGVLEWRGRSLSVMMLERGREEILMQGGYHVAREVAVMVLAELIEGMTQREKVRLAGDDWLVSKMTPGPHGYAKLILDREGL